MSSIIEGYNYDVFISYRQNDNKYDGWVTEFVDNLKKEIEANIKDKVAVYFDISPTDGLLETDSVDKSLADKLKCLIFIPIISRTYCDAKSFAWQHEFCAFNKLAKEDKFGRDIRLASGNVASRILPVKIHELDPEDKTLLEDELGGVLRGIEFIYKEAGVNRPLTPTDNPDKNFNKTFYRDQINKIANAVKEIITALKKQNQHPQEVSEQDSVEKPVHQKNRRTKIIAGTIIALVLIILGIFFIPKLFRPEEQLEKSIAVLPFNLLSDEPDKQYLADGMMDAILLHLSKIEDLRLLSRTSTEQYKESGKTMTEIGRELGVAYLLEGSFQKYGDDVRLIVQLIQTGKEGHVWANQYDRKWDDIFSIQSEVAQTIARELDAVITPEENQLIEKTPTTSLTAYDFFQRGREKYWKGEIEKAEDFYKKSLVYDSTFAQAYTGLAWVYWDKHYWETVLSEDFMDSVLIFCDIALSYNDQLSEAYTIKGCYYNESGKTEQAIKEFDKAITFNPNDWMAYQQRGVAYEHYDFIKRIDSHNKAVSLNRGEQLPMLLRTLGDSYSNAGFVEKAKYYYQEALKLDGDSLQYYRTFRTFLVDQGDYSKSIEFGKKIYAIDTSDLFHLFLTGQDYLFLGEHEEALKYFKKWLKTSKNLGHLTFHGMHRVGLAYYQNGYKKEAEYYFNELIKYCERLKKMERQSLFYATYDLAATYAFLGDREKGYENLKLVAEIPVWPLWYLTFLRDDPLFNSIRNEPEFKQIVRDQEAKYNAEHERARKWLEEQGML